MKKAKWMEKIIIGVIIMIIMVWTSANISRAATNFDVKVETASTNIAKDQTAVTLYLKLGNYSGDGVLGYEGTLHYDKTVFESATIKGLNDWETPDYEETTGKFLSTTKKAKANTNIAEITLKLKRGTTAKTTKVSMNDFIISDGTEEANINQSITYTLLANQVEENKNENADKNTNTIPTNIVVNTNTVLNGKTNTSSNITVESISANQKDQTLAGTTIPQTGSGMGAVLTIVGIFIIGLIAYIRYRLIPLK
ncbi:MAG: cohesin domain-containing protein [Clostridia bacterium]|jgi:hypothetical protein